MKIERAIEILNLIPSRVERALSAKEILSRLDHNKLFDDSEIRKIYRDLSSLEAIGLVSFVEMDKRLYYKNSIEISRLFIDEAMALSLYVSQSIFKGPLSEITLLNASEFEKIATACIDNSERSIRKLSKKIRIVPDGIGRLCAKIDQEVVSAALEGLSKSQVLNFKYRKSGGELIDGKIKPFGVVVKDGAIYLVCRRGIEQKMLNLPLHRFESLELSGIGFNESIDLDGYINSSHQFAHWRGGVKKIIDLVVMVSPSAIYHFEERPLSKDQVIEAPSYKDEWFKVSASIPDTVMLTPWLLSMGENIKILSPDHIVEEVSRKAHEMSRMYSGRA